MTDYFTCAYCNRQHSAQNKFPGLLPLRCRECQSRRDKFHTKAKRGRTRLMRLGVGR